MPVVVTRLQQPQHHQTLKTKGHRTAAGAAPGDFNAAGHTCSHRCSQQHQCCIGIYPRRIAARCGFSLRRRSAVKPRSVLASLASTDWDHYDQSSAGSYEHSSRTGDVVAVSQESATGSELHESAKRDPPSNGTLQPVFGIEPYRGKTSSNTRPEERLRDARTRQRATQPDSEPLTAS